MSNAQAAQKAPQFETITVESASVGCDGGGGPLGHPLVYLHLGHDRQVTCPYCSRTFVLAEGAKLGGH
ncbi:zinc-finger domain-containing protein [Magnetospirillum moscoviense]|uniref:Zinc finger CHCC-type domain-containing protein n=1 Tax=Magnetospirillum moscoviense TaxID=1437059 RepID=A0A178MXM9_9PROT|nr:zinc-finger domain-containing protein [Magnetospirillum moscoviense]MBF0324729.1 zinc-finger domain-containing protein [Alphaproteobacteria bacterium]OAN56857.1 hypothetical protein A6A05_07755 [Magnetospirillum moscoviense]